MAKNTNNIDEYKHSGYWVEFDSKGCFFIGNRFGRSCITFGVDMGSYVHVDYKKKKIFYFLAKIILKDSMALH